MSAKSQKRRLARKYPKLKKVKREPTPEEAERMIYGPDKHPMVPWLMRSRNP